MFTEPKIILTTDLSKRGYITYYLNGIRQREYNGKRLGLDLNPNYFKSYNERFKLLKKLAFEFEKALEKGWHPPSEVKDSPKTPTLEEAIQAILRTKLASDLSNSYKCRLFQNWPLVFLQTGHI